MGRGSGEEGWKEKEERERCEEERKWRRKGRGGEEGEGKLMI